MRWLLVGLSLLLGAGCTSYHAMLLDTAEYLNARQVAGCLRIDAHGGGGFGATVNGSLSGFIATGGIDPRLCGKEGL